MILLLGCSQGFVVGDTSEPDPAHESVHPDETGRPEETGESGGESGGETADTAPPWDPDAPLELCINEFMPENVSSAQDETSAWPDWIELHNPNDTDVALDGWTITDFRYEPDKHVFSGGTVIPAGGYLVLWADSSPETGSDHLSFKLSSDGGEVALYAPDGRGSIVTYGEVAADFSIARQPDCCAEAGCIGFDYLGTPGETNVEAVYEEVDLLPAGSTWRYYDLGANPGAGWESAGFDDSAWQSGAGPLGYGDTHIVTTVGYGGVDAAKYVTTWFRTTLEVTGVEAYDSFTLSLLRDDGALVYLNGVEVARDNLPDALDDDTFASASTDNETAHWDFALTGLVEGENTIAVEVHQASLDSSDLGFDLAITGERRVE